MACSRPTWRPWRSPSPGGDLRRRQPAALVVVVLTENYPSATRRFLGNRSSYPSAIMMRTGAWFAVCLGLVACGDNGIKDTPPKLVTPRIVVTLPEDGSATVDATAVDAQTTTLTYTATAPAHGDLTGTGPTFTYVPAKNYNGPDTLTVTISDGKNALMVPVDITVLPVDDAPVASDVQVSTNADQGVAVKLVASDVDSAELTYAIVTQPAHGTVAGVPPDLSYTPTSHYVGSDSFSYQASDGMLASAVAVVTITIAGVTTCGDGIVEGSEQCDDGNNVNTDGCLNNCMTARCGDGVVQSEVEQCDDGNADNSDACLDTCVAARCGDGFVELGVEQCDDGNNSNTDACLNTCAAARCGDGFVEFGVEQCDDGNNSNNDACLSTCAAANCGDGFVELGVEQCDDGNTSNTDGCLNTCVVALCGDGFVELGVEQCDDGNNSNNDACLNTCAAASCGDGFVELGVEQCDDANSSNTDGCLNTCVVALCGDGFVDAGVEQCDDGNTNNNDGCRNDCTTPACGDGILDAGEECDDGNTADDDGCGHSCKIERCGDGLVQFSRGEECDDGNTVSGDGCDASCLAEVYATTPAVLISGGLSNCTTGVASATHKVAVDSDGRIYAVFPCGSSGLFSISTDRGLTFSTPFDLTAQAGGPALEISQIAVGTGEVGTAYAALELTSGEVVLRKTSDFGTTWGPAVSIGAASNTSSGLSLDSFNDDVYLGFETSSGVSVFHSRDQAVSFTSSLAPLTTTDFDLTYDVRTRTVVVAASSPPSFRVLISGDQGQTWSSEVNPPGQQFFSDWAMSNGQLYVSGTHNGIVGNSTQIYVIPTSSPSTSTAISGLPQVTTPQSRSLTADAAGNVYVLSQRDAGTIEIDRLQFGAVSFDTADALPGNGTEPVGAALPGSNGVVVIYTQGGNTVWVTVRSPASGGIPGG